MKHLYPTNLSEYFTKYVNIQLEGKCNMILDRSQVADILGLTIDEYKWIQDHYMELHNRFPWIRENAEKKFMESIKSK